MWDLPGSGIEPGSPALAGRFFTTEPPWKPHVLILVFAFMIRLCFFLCPLILGTARQFPLFLSLRCGLCAWPCLAFSNSVLVCSGETPRVFWLQSMCFGGSLSSVLSWSLAIPSVVRSTATYSRDRGGKGQPMGCVSTGQLPSKELRGKQGGMLVMAYHHHDSYIDFYFSYKHWA